MAIMVKIALIFIVVFGTGIFLVKGLPYIWDKHKKKKYKKIIDGTEDSAITPFTDCLIEGYMEDFPSIDKLVDLNRLREATVNYLLNKITVGFTRNKQNPIELEFKLNSYSDDFYNKDRYDERDLYTYLKVPFSNIDIPQMHKLLPESIDLVYQSVVDELQKKGAGIILKQKSSYSSKSFDFGYIYELKLVVALPAPFSK